MTSLGAAYLVRPWDPADTASLVAGLARLAPDGFPPRMEAASVDELQQWLLEDVVRARVVIECDGRAVAHAQLCEPHAYVTDHLPQDCSPGLTEIGKIFVDPDHSRRGLGRALLTEALSVVRSLGRRPVLDVLSTSQVAIRLYQDMGLRPTSSFRGVDGLNHLFVEAHDPCAAGPDEVRAAETVEGSGP